MASAHGNLAHLLNSNYKADVTNWLAEDCPSFDYGGFVVGDAPAEAKLLGKSAGILAGVPWFDEVFKQLDCTVEWHTPEGAPITPIAHCATVRGPARQLLLGERVALNTLARCSGIASASAALKTVLQTTASAQTPPHTAPILAGTRKTTPGFRQVEKYGMLVGGADPHRYDLSQMTMLKDNHVWACAGSITRAVRAAKAAAGFAGRVEVECRTEAEAVEAVRAGADVVMLDNFAPEQAARTAARLKVGFGARRGEVSEVNRLGIEQDEFVKEDQRSTAFLIEVSGGLTEENVRAYVGSDVDVLSTSSIHQGVKHVDFSLKIVH